MLGFNDHSLPAPHLGFVHERYFTGGSISPSPRDLSCTTEKALRSRLDRFVALFDEVVEPFFASLASRSQLADALSDQTTMDYIRGLLYLADADADRAAMAARAGAGREVSLPTAAACRFRSAACRRSGRRSLLRRHGRNDAAGSGRTPKSSPTRFSSAAADRDFAASRRRHG